MTNNTAQQETVIEENIPVEMDNKGKGGGGEEQRYSVVIIFSISLSFGIGVCGGIGCVVCMF